MLLSGKRTDALCFCVQSLPLAERLQLKGQLRAAHNGVMVVVKVFVVIAGQRTGFLRRDDAELGENREDGIRNDGGGAVLHFEGNADPLIFDAHGIECAGTRFAEDAVAEGGHQLRADAIGPCHHFRMCNSMVEVNQYFIYQSVQIVGSE